MKNFKTLLLTLGTVGLVACGGGGSSGGGGGTPDPGSQYPVGYCIESASGAIANPQIVTGATSESSVYAYNNDGSFLGGNAVVIDYGEHAWDPTVELALYSMDSIAYTQPLPTGYCAMSPSSIANSYLPNSTMYFSNCSAVVTNGILTFNSMYSIYESGSMPGTGSPIKVGTFNFTCPFSTF